MFISAEEECESDAVPGAAYGVPPCTRPDGRQVHEEAAQPQQPGQDSSSKQTGDRRKKNLWTEISYGTNKAVRKEIINSIRAVNNLGGVGPVNNRPSTD